MVEACLSEEEDEEELEELYCERAETNPFPPPASASTSTPSLPTLYSFKGAH